MIVYRIKSSHLKAKGEKIESIHRSYVEKRLREVRATQDPEARMLRVPLSR